MSSGGKMQSLTEESNEERLFKASEKLPIRDNCDEQKNGVLKD